MFTLPGKTHISFIIALLNYNSENKSTHLSVYSMVCSIFTICATMTSVDFKTFSSPQKGVSSRFHQFHLNSLSPKNHSSILTLHISLF